MMRDDEYILNLLAALVHLRIFTFEHCVKDVHSFVKKVSDRVPHLEYLSTRNLNYCYKRVGGELVDCDRKEFPR
jgi:hypothetical protein